MSGTSVVVQWLWPVCAVALAITAAPAAAGVIRDDRPQRLYLAEGRRFPSVGYMDVYAPRDGWSGSGTLVAPNWVLTAAHVLSGASRMTFNINGQSYAARQWITNANWRGNVNIGYDIALVRLSRPVAGIAPAQRYTGTNELHRIGTAVGYGMTGDGWNGATITDDRKRGGDNAIDAFRASGRMLVSDFDCPADGVSFNETGSSRALNREYLIASGDSGGGVFIRRNGRELLAGVNSYVEADIGPLDSGYGNVSAHTRVSAFNDWIDDVLAGDMSQSVRRQFALYRSGTVRPVAHWRSGLRHSRGIELTGLPSAGGHAYASTTTEIPEPGTLGLFCAGGIALLRRRARRERASGGRGAA